MAPRNFSIRSLIASSDSTAPKLPLSLYVAIGIFACMLAIRFIPEAYKGAAVLTLMFCSSVVLCFGITANVIRIKSAQKAAKQIEKVDPQLVVDKNGSTDSGML